jgi:N-acetylglucosamine-6-phosphate deacetylase
MPQLNFAKSPVPLSIRGGCLITPHEERFADVEVSAGLIEQIGSPGLKEGAGAEILMAEGCFVTPGLIDLQVNGGPECDLWDCPSDGSLTALCKTLSGSGVTGFLPTLITDDIEHLKEKMARLSAHSVSSQRSLLSLCPGQPAIEGGAAAFAYARMFGVHLEGPFLSPARPGVHPPQWIKPLSKCSAADLINDSVALITLAPETDRSGEAIKFLHSKGIRVALGHSDATFEEAKAAFDLGVTLMTHTFNALPPLKHRGAGAVGAALLDPRVFCCVIADGLHVDPAVVELIVKVKGADRTILVTDRAAVGTSQGGLVGSSLMLDQAVRNLVEWKVASFADAIKMACWNPALALGIEKKVGQLAPGGLADLVVWDAETLTVKDVIIGGRLLERRK